MTRAAATTCLLATLLPGCFTVEWSRSTVDEPIPELTVSALAERTSDLGDALDALGAPLYVWELPFERAALAWGWFDNTDLGVRLSVPTRSPVDPSISFNDIDNDLRGYVLVFDDDESLLYVRKGYLAQLADELRQRPSLDWREALRHRGGSSE